MRRRIPELDGYRVLMVFIVSWFHIWQQSWLRPYVGDFSLDFLVRAGYMPVDATILLSGFLMYLPWLDRREAGLPRERIRDFYRRRAARVLPSLVFVSLLMLFAVAIPKRQYATAGGMAVDLLTHFTFTFPFSASTYLGTHLGAASWTLAIEVHFYVLFPFLARLADRRPGAVMLGMAAAAAYFRGFCLWYFTDYQMVVNQMISFMDVYALGMALAVLYRRLAALTEKWRARAEDPVSRRKLLLLSIAATVVLAAGIWGFQAIMRVQARSGSHAEIQAGQMARRLEYALACGTILLSLPFCVRPVRWLFGNPVMRFLAGISMNYYLLHQNIALWLKDHHIPDSVWFTEDTLPNFEGDLTWQMRYTWLCFGLSVIAAILVTYLVEKPCATLMRKGFAALDRRRPDRKKAA